MLKENISKLIAKELDNLQKQGKVGPVTIELYMDELRYVKDHQLFLNELNDSVLLSEKDNNLRFENAYIERCDKETEQFLSQENASFLKKPIEYLKKHMKEFIYIESEWLDLIGTDAISLEADDVFDTYDVMLGLKLQKKYQTSLKEQLNTMLNGEEPKFDLMFNNEDGLWDINFTLNYVEGFSEEITIGEACQIIYRFLFKIVENVDSGKA